MSGAVAPVGISPIRPVDNGHAAILGEDAFSSKVGSWAFTGAPAIASAPEKDTPFYGRFAMAATDAVALDYLEGQVGHAAQLPTGVRFRHALEELANDPEHALVSPILQEEAVLYDYLAARLSMEVHE